MKTVVSNIAISAALGAALGGCLHMAGTGIDEWQYWGITLLAVAMFFHGLQWGAS